MILHCYNFFFTFKELWAIPTLDKHLYFGSIHGTESFFKTRWICKHVLNPPAKKFNYVLKLGILIIFQDNLIKMDSKIQIQSFVVSFYLSRKMSWYLVFNRKEHFWEISTIWLFNLHKDQYVRIDRCIKM